MKKPLSILVICFLSTITMAQETKTPEVKDTSDTRTIDVKFKEYVDLSVYKELNEREKSKPKELSRITVGVAIGYNQLLESTYDYSLTTDSEHKLKIEELNKGSFVVSSALIFRFHKGEVVKDDNEIMTRTYDASQEKEVLTSANWRRKFTGIISLNLLDINSDNGISFNKSIDGGIGIGYQINSEMNIACLYELKKIRQLRSYIVKEYENESIPNGDDVYNALSTSDNNLFYDKTVEGISIKLIFNFSSL